MKKLNLGCNKDYREGWVNHDVNKKEDEEAYHSSTVKADVYHNLDKFPYPFKNEEFDYVLASHIVEHLQSPRKFFKEMKRILKKGGKICVVVPHFTNPMSYTPLHKGFYSYKTVNHVCDCLRIVEKKLVFTPKYKFMEVFARKYPIFYENTPLRLFPAKEIKVVLEKK